MKKSLIAVVEDDEDDREFICSALENSDNVNVISFPGAEEFFKFIQSAEILPDLVVTDLRMPLISGFDVIDKIKTNEITKNTIVVVLSTSSNEEDIKKAQKMGASGYFVKPYALKGYSEITRKIMENLGLGAVSFSNMIENFLKTFLICLPKNA